MTHTESQIMLSTVTPVYAGADYLDALITKLRILRTHWTENGFPLRLCESIFVVDDAVDNSARLLHGISAQEPWVKVIELSRNFGQHPATVAGILHTSGDWVVTLDEDLQHPPDKIKALLRIAVQEHLDIVYAKPIGKVHLGWMRDLTSRNFKRFLSVLAGDGNIQIYNSFRLIRGDVARGAASVCGPETYLDVALGWFSRRVGWVPIEMVDQRTQDGKNSGYNLWRLFSHARRLIITTRVKSFRVGAFFGLLGFLGGVSFAIYLILVVLFGSSPIEVRGWASLMVGILLLGGMILFFLGIILEYTTVLLLHTQGKPSFFIVERGSDDIILAAIDKL